MMTVADAGGRRETGSADPLASLLAGGGRAREVG